MAGRRGLRGRFIDDGLGQLLDHDYSDACTGMTMLRLPMTVWALFITAILQAFALPVLTAGAIMQMTDRLLGTGFYLPELASATTRRQSPVVVSRCCGSICSGSIRTQRCTS